MKLEVSQLSRKLYDVEISVLELVNGAEIFIGRSDDCHVVLNDQQISRRHAVLSFEDGKLRLKKLSAMGNLSVNGGEVEECSLGEGGKFSVADYTLRVKDLPAAEQAEPGQEERPAESFSAKAGEFAEPEKGPDKAPDKAPEMDDAEEPPEDVEADLEGASAFEQETFDDPNGGDNADSEETESEESAEEAFESADEGDPAFAGEDAFAADGENFGGEEDFGGGFGDESGGGFEEDVGESTQVFQSFAAYYLEIDGENAPFDKYKVEDKEVYIGRDPEKCQIILKDPEVSSVHAVIKKTLINCFIEDLGSSNGTVYNGSRVNKAELGNNDNFQIGSTIFTVKIVSDLIESEKDILMPVEDGQEVEVEEVVEEEVDYDALAPETDEYSMEETQEKSLIKRIWKDPEKRKKLIYAIAGLAVVSLFLEPESDKPAVSSNAPKEAKAKEAENAAKNPAAEQRKQLSPEVAAKLEENYALALAKYEAGEYYQAKEYLEVIRGIDPEYKDTATLRKLVQQGHEELMRLKEEEQAEKERKKRQLKVMGLLKKAEEAVDKREVAVAESLFAEILEIDPENMDVPQLRLEIDAYKEERRRKKEEAARKKALRQSMVDALQPGKNLFLKEEWYKAIDRLEKFTRKKGMDEDLVKEATDMLKKARKNLSAQVNPLLGRARSFKEGQDLKRAYETYGEVLKYDPSNEEALNARDNIRETLRTRSMKVYREALIAESLSLFDEAREKFEEVRQISPVNSEYYNKAEERLRNYLE